MSNDFKKGFLTGAGALLGVLSISVGVYILYLPYTPTIMSLQKNILPATLNLDEPIDSRNINLIPNSPIEKNISYALSNSFGFGGTNTALLFKSF